MTGTVGVIVAKAAPGMVPGHRDIALLKQSLRAAGLVPIVRAARVGGPGFVSISRSMIAAGVRVLIIGTGDRAAGIRAEHVAELAGVDVIEYGGVTIGGSARYAVSPDYEQIGRLEAQTMIRCLTARGLTRPRIILVDGGTNVDENAVLLDIGAHRVLDPLVSSGGADLVEEISVNGWHTDRAAAAFTLALDTAGGSVDGVVAASDAIASEVIGVLGRRGLDTTQVAGQGPGVEGLWNIATGRQSLTVTTDLEREADAAAQLARALVTRDHRALAALPLSRFDDPTAPSRELRTLMVPGQAAVTASGGSLGPRPTSRP
ncbi:MAG: substrate-binding domain-containing protein [Nocardioides sp.]